MAIKETSGQTSTVSHATGTSKRPYRSVITPYASETPSWGAASGSGHTPIGIQATSEEGPHALGSLRGTRYTAGATIASSFSDETPPAAPSISPQSSTSSQCESSSQTSAADLPLEEGATTTCTYDANNVVKNFWCFFNKPWTATWKYVLAIGIGLCVLAYLCSLERSGGHILYTFLLSACIPVSIITFFSELDITHRVTLPVALLVAFVGGGLSCGLTLLLQNESVVLAGFIEEPMKGVCLVLLAMYPKRFPGILSGVVLGVCVGAGFAIIETMIYAYSESANSPSTEILAIRGLLSPFMHLAWTGALGGALWMARGATGLGWKAFQSKYVWFVFGGMILCHVIWNTIGVVAYVSISLWVLIFYYVKQGAAQALNWGFSPQKGC